MWVCLELLIGSKFFQLRTVHTYIYIPLSYTFTVTRDHNGKKFGRNVVGPDPFARRRKNTT